MSTQFSLSALARGVEGIGDMAWHLAGRNQYGVEAKETVGIFGMLRQPVFSGGDDALLRTFGYRFGRSIERVASLHLDERDIAPPPRHDVDLADRRPPAPCCDPEALGDQKHCRPAFGRNTGFECPTPLQT